MIRMSTDQLGGITYTYPNLTAFLANTPTSIQYFGDLSEASPFHNGATGPKNIKQEYYVAYAQDEWRVRPNLTLNYGLRYDYYAPLREADNRIVKFNIDTGTIDPDTTPLYQSNKTNFEPPVSATFRPEQDGHPRRRGISSAPDNRDRFSRRANDQYHGVDGALLALHRPAWCVRTSSTTRTIARISLERTPTSTRSGGVTVHGVGSTGLRANGGDGAYVGGQAEPLLRSIANRTIGVELCQTALGRFASSTSCPQRDAPREIQRPYAKSTQTAACHDTTTGCSSR